MLDNEFPPLGGGTGVVNYHLLREFAAYPRLTVDVVTSSRSPDREEREPFADRITIYKVPVDNRNIHHATNRELLRYAWRGWLMSRRLMAGSRYDLSFAFAGVPAGGISYLLNRTAGLPYVVSLQGPDVPGFETRYGYLYPMLRPVIRRIWRHAACVTAISRDHCRLARRTMPELDIPQIPNGVDVSTFCPGEPRQDEEEPGILCVGRLIERKGQQHLLQALAALRDSQAPWRRVIFVGTGDNEGALHAQAEKLGLTDRVRFAGFVGRDEMPSVYRRADIFVLPSQNEGMSMALLEALASGLPVIVTNTGGTEELVEHGRNGLVVPWGDVPSLTAALRRLIEDVAQRRRMGEASRAVAKRFEWAAIARQYLTLCEQIVEEARFGKSRPVAAPWGKVSVQDHHREADRCR
jgi:glycosyltransferase involved in cell wall biosynthesis